MIKTYITGIVLGVAGVMVGLYMIPVIDQHREVSVIAVAPNGGNTETFQVNIPMDRILVGSAGAKTQLPADLTWPDVAAFDGSRTELYKLRNSRNAVVGIASRISASNNAVGNIVEWVLHLPARGSMYVTINPTSAAAGRSGKLRAGTREFDGMVGTVSERWVADTSITDDSSAGRIELLANYVLKEPVNSAGDVK